MSEPAALSTDRDRPTGLESEVPPLRLLALAAVLGATIGLAGASFRVAVEAANAARSALFETFASNGVLAIGLSALATAGTTAAALSLVRRFAPEAGGSGVQEIEGALDGVRPLRWRRVLPVKFLGGLLALGGGLVLGREGPTIQLGGNLGAALAERLHLPKPALRTLVAAGAGAGLAAAFNAPFAGVLLVIEEMRPQFRYTFTSVQSVVIACALADVTVRAVTGQGPVLQILSYAPPALASLWLFPVLGAVFGVLGLAFGRALVAALDFFADLAPAARRFSGVAIGAAIGALAFAVPSSVGGGDDLIPRLLAAPPAVRALLGLFVLRFATSIVSYGSGAPGGIFAPMLALGALLGMAYGHAAHALFPGWIAHPGVFAVAGMGALFTATVRAPITGVALAIELTGNYEQILPLMLTCASATIVAEFLGSEPIYTVLLRRTLAREAASASERPGVHGDAR